MKRLKLYSVFTFLNIGLFAFGASFSSTGSGNWTAGGVWSGGVAPSNPLAGGNIVTINAGHTITVGALTLAGGGKLIVNGELIINGLLSSNGFGSSITINNGGKISVTTGGFSNSTFSKLIVNQGGLLDVKGDFVNLIDADITLNGNILVTGNFNNYGVFTASDIGIGSTGFLGVTGYVANSGGVGVISNAGLIQAGGTIVGVSNTGSGQTRPGVTSPLPIELTYFKAVNKPNNIALNWQTATELNNDYFTLERSADGVYYENIGTVRGAGTSMTALNYSYTDNNPLNGISYYRLKQTDYDGKFEVFSPVSVSYLNESEIKIGSNLTAKEITIRMSGEMGLGTAKIYNVIGVLVKTVEINENFTTLNVSDIPNGNYILVISANNKTIAKKIMVR